MQIFIPFLMPNLVRFWTLKCGPQLNLVVVFWIFLFSLTWKPKNLEDSCRRCRFVCAAVLVFLRKFPHQMTCWWRRLTLQPFDGIYYFLLSWWSLQYQFHCTRLLAFGPLYCPIITNRFLSWMMLNLIILRNCVEQVTHFVTLLKFIALTLFIMLRKWKAMPLI